MGTKDSKSSEDNRHARNDEKDPGAERMVQACPTLREVESSRRLDSDKDRKSQSTVGFGIG